MIAYEELCEALERHHRRQQNQAELDQLNSAPASRPTPQRSAPGAETFSLKPQPGEEDYEPQPPEDTHEIDVDDGDMVVDDR